MTRLEMLRSMFNRTMMSLIRGINSAVSCPRCLIKTTDMGDPSVHAPLRTSENVQATIQEAGREKLVGAREEILKSAGLRDIEVLHNYLYPVRILTTFLFRTCFGRSHIRTRIERYHLTGSIPSPVVSSGNISGHASKNTWGSWVGLPLPR